MKLERHEGKTCEYFWCMTCAAVMTDVSIEYSGGCWRCGGQMVKDTGQLPPEYKIRECHKAEKQLLRTGRDATGKNIISRAVAACGFHLRRVK